MVAPQEPERHTVAVDLQALPLVEPLIRLIAGWRGASVQINGFVLRREEVTALLRVLACYRDRERARPRRTLLLGPTRSRAGTRPLPHRRPRAAVATSIRGLRQI